VPFVAAAVSPHPPLLIPEMAGRASPELDDLRAALSIALDLVFATAPDLLVVIGSGPLTSTPDPNAVGDFAGFGLPLRVSLSGLPPAEVSPAGPASGPLPADRMAGRSSGPLPADRTAGPASGSLPADRMAGPASGSLPADRMAVRASGSLPADRVAGSESGGLPLSLAVGAWLLRDRPAAPPRIGRTVAADLDPAACAAIGRELADLAPRVALLVMGDGSACRGEKAPGYADDRAPAFDRLFTDALRRGDAGALASIPERLATELLAAGRAPWQVLAGAAGEVPVDAEVRYDAAPYGVQYTVATWVAA
jgi:hypothetical protein